MEKIIRKREKADLYARAFYEAALEGWIKKLARVWGDIARDDLLEKLDAPEVPFQEKQQLINQLVGDETPAEIRNFIFLLASKGHLHYLPEILDELGRLSRGGAARRVVNITTAVPLTEEEKRALQARLIARFGSDLDFRYDVDPEILGGVIIRIGDKVIDGSIAGRLESLRERLKREI